MQVTGLSQRIGLQVELSTANHVVVVAVAFETLCSLDCLENFFTGDGIDGITVILVEFTKVTIRAPDSTICIFLIQCTCQLSIFHWH